LPDTADFGAPGYEALVEGRITAAIRAVSFRICRAYRNSENFHRLRPDRANHATIGSIFGGEDENG
jgi:hypothetical protein